MKDDWGLQKLIKILFIVFLVCVIFALVFKGIVSIARKHKPKEKEIEQVEKETEKEAKKQTKDKTEKAQNEPTQDFKNLTYNDLENRIKIAAERYQNDNYQGTLESTETWILKYRILIDEGYLTTKLLDPNGGDECTGYVVFYKKETKISYTPYIKCGNNYKTAGYDETN